MKGFNVEIFERLESEEPFAFFHLFVAAAQVQAVDCEEWELRFQNGSNVCGFIEHDLHDIN